MISENQQRYIEEYEKHKHIVIEPGVYRIKKNEHYSYEVIEVDLDNELVRLKKDNFVSQKTLHWCRKNLVRID